MSRSLVESLTDEKLALMHNIYTTDILEANVSVDEDNDGRTTKDTNLRHNVERINDKTSEEGEFTGSSTQSSDALHSGSGYTNDHRIFSCDIDSVEAEKMLDPYDPSNIGILASYLTVGFVIYFIQAPLNFYMVSELGASPAQQSVVLGLLQLPWGLKIFGGFLSDWMPIGGMRQKPYMTLGWLIFVGCNILLMLMGTPDIKSLALLIFGMNLGFILADLSTDAMVVERSRRFEHFKSRGVLQATGYVVRFFGALIGGVSGSLLYNEPSWGWGYPMWSIFCVNALVPLFFVFPFMYRLVEVPPEYIPSVKAQISSIWMLVQRREVCRPCAFVFLYNTCLIANPAWTSYLIEGLGFIAFDIGLLVLGATFLSFFALMIYKRYFYDTPWRLLYASTTILSIAAALLQLVLVFDVLPLHIRGRKVVEVLLAMIGYGIGHLVMALQFLPACRMFLVMSHPSEYSPVDIVPKDTVHKDMEDEGVDERVHEGVDEVVSMRPSMRPDVGESDLLLYPQAAIIGGKERSGSRDREWDSNSSTQWSAQWRVHDGRGHGQLGRQEEIAKGAGFAILIMMSNLAGAVSYSLGAVAALVSGVTLDSIADSRSRDTVNVGLWHLTVVCGLAHCIGLVLLPCLPQGTQEQITNQESQSGHTSKTAGVMFLGLLASSFVSIVLFNVWVLLQ